MENNQIILECKCVKFYSSKDEDAFFGWIKNISCITQVKGVRDTICLLIDKKNIDDEQLHDLMALFRRYKINMKKLEIFLNETNTPWFERWKKSYSINVYPAKTNQL